MKELDLNTFTPEMRHTHSFKMSTKIPTPYYVPPIRYEAKHKIDDT